MEHGLGLFHADWPRQQLLHVICRRYLHIAPSCWIVFSSTGPSSYKGSSHATHLHAVTFLVSRFITMKAFSRCTHALYSWPSVVPGRAGQLMASLSSLSSHKMCACVVLCLAVVSHCRCMCTHRLTHWVSVAAQHVTGWVQRTHCAMHSMAAYSIKEFYSKVFSLV